MTTQNKVSGKPRERQCARCGDREFAPLWLTSCGVELCGAGPFCKLCRQSHWDRVHEGVSVVADGSRGMKRGV